MTEPNEEDITKLGSVLLFVAILSVAEITSRTILKKADDNNDKILSWRVGVSIALYIGVILLLFYSMQFGKFITVSALWDAGTILLAIASSYFILNESISPGEWVGLSLIATGVIVLAVYTK